MHFDCEWQMLIFYIMVLDGFTMLYTYTHTYKYRYQNTCVYWSIMVLSVDSILHFFQMAIQLLYIIY